MINTKRYLKYHLIQRLPYLLIIAPLSVWFVYNTCLSSWSGHIQLYYPYLVLTILSMLTPILELKIFKKRKDLDNLFSLPIPRTHLLGVHLFTGLVTNLFVFTLCVITSVIRGASTISPEKIVYFLPYWGLGLFWGILIYGIYAFVFYEGNTTLDGVAFVLGHAYALNLFVGGLNITITKFAPSFIIENRLKTFLVSLQFTPGTTLSWTAEYYEDILSPLGSFGVHWTSAKMFVLAFYLLLGLCAYAAFFLYSPKKRVEKTGDISNSWFGYRTLLPMGSFLFFAVGSELLVITIVAFALTLGGYAIYRRGFRLKVSDWVILAALTLFSVVLGII